MKGKLKLENGKEIDIELSEKQLKEIQPKKKKKTGYERVSKCEKYYVSDNSISCGYCDLNEEANLYDDNFYKNADYYSNKTLTLNNTRADTLMRQLRRFAVENSEKELDWHWHNDCKYYIYYNYNCHAIDVGSSDGSLVAIRYFGQIYFDSKKVAKKAINEFKEELLWYFTEYRDRV